MNQQPSTGFTVDTDALMHYAQRTGSMAGDLEKLAKKKVNSVRDLAEDSFGKVGKETGFATALDHFAGALEYQVKAVATSANRFSRAVDRAATTYVEAEAEAAENFGRAAK